MNISDFTNLTANELKKISSLSQQKFRAKEKLFLIEGKKIIKDAIDADQEIEIIFFTEKFYEKNQRYVMNLKTDQKKYYLMKEKYFEKVVDSKSPEGIAAVVPIDDPSFSIKDVGDEELIIYLDKISDPGNVGTIIRTADWFGIKTILLSENCVDLYNSKTIRATMGSIFHCNIFQKCDQQTLKQLKQKGYKIIATTVNGNIIERKYFKPKSVLIFSSESHGLSVELNSIADEFLTIPRFGKAESLNVSSAAAVIFSLIKLR